MLNTARVPHFCPVLWDFGRAGLLPGPGRAEAHFLLHEPQLQKGLWRARRLHQSQFRKNREEEKDKKESKQAE